MREKAYLAACLFMLSACGGDDTKSSPTDNKPNIYAGADVSAYGKKSVQLTPTFSTDVSNLSSVRWTQAESDPLQVSIKTDSENNASFIAPDIYDKVTLHFTVTAAFSDGTSSSDDIEVTLIPAEHSLSLALQGLGQSIKITDQHLVVIGGSVTSDHPLKSIKVINMTTGITYDAGIADSWQAEIALAEGDNTIDISAISDDDTSLSISTEITYYPNIDFITPLQFDTTTLYLGQDPKSVIVTIGTNNPNNPTITLIDSANQEIATLSDDGVLPDEIQGDGIFTAKFDAQATNVGSICYRAKLTDTNAVSYQSEKLCLWGADSYDNADVTSAVMLADSVKLLIDNSLEAGSDVKAAAQAAYEKMQTNPAIGASGLSPDSGLWWVDDKGILGLYHPVIAGSKSGVELRRNEGQPPVLKATFTTQYYSYDDQARHSQSVTAIHTGINQSKSAISGSKAAEDNRIKSSRAVIVSPFINNPNVSPANNFGSTDDYHSVWQTLKSANSCQLSADKELINDGTVNVTLDSYKDFSLYGYIHLSTHGDNYYNGLLSLWKDEWGPNDFLKGALSLVAIYTGIALPQNDDGSYNISGYEEDLHMKRLAIGPGGLLVVLPSFFDHYLTTLPNSLVALSACRSMHNNSLANVLMAKGAGAILGYDDYVLSTYAQNTTNTILQEMLNNDSTFGEAVTVAKSTYGASDGSATDAKLVTTGADNLKLPYGSLTNLDFEDGVLGVWSKDGDGRVVTQLGVTKPTGGNFMGIVSTGLGFTTTSGTIEQTACLASSAKTLRFNWKMFSEEFREYCHTEYDDSFSVTVCNEDSTTCKSFKTSVNQLCTEGGLLPSDIHFDQGDVYKTEWKNESIDISELAGQRVKLSVYSSDKGDSIYDTAILVDDITVE